MEYIFCAAGIVPIKIGQEWALRVENEEEVHFVILRVEEFWNHQVSFELVRTEWLGEESDPVQPLYQRALENFGYNGRYYFASETWTSLWESMMPNPGETTSSSTP